MAFASGPVSFQRFLITGRVPDELSPELLKSLNAKTFGRLATLPDDTQLGWIGPSHLFESKLRRERIAFGSFVHLAMRIDKLRPPGNVLKAYTRMEEDAALEASGREFLSKGEKRKAREAAVARVEQELKSGAFRRMSSVPVLLDLAGGCAYLGGTGPAAGEKLMKLFSDTFGVALEPAGPERVAHRILAVHKNVRALEKLAPLRLVPRPEGYRAEDEAGGFAGGDLAFLGKELLSWLWWQIDRAEGALRVTSGDAVSALIERTLRLKCDYGLTGADLISADNPTGLPEARAALRVGKQPVKAGLVLGHPAGEFRLTLDAESFTVSGLTLPDAPQEQDYRARIEGRFEMIVDAANLLDALFEVFLLSRTGREWADEFRAMCAWAAGGRAPKVRTATA